MKKLVALVLALLFAPAALGQSVGASQIKKKANAGLVADTANALAIGVYRGTTAPASPVTGQPWLDTSVTPAVLKSYNGTAWEISPTGAAITQADLTSLPASPTDGMIVWASSLRRAVIYDATLTQWYYLDASNRPVTANHSTDIAGYPNSPIGAAPAASGSVTAGGAVTVGTHVCAVVAYNSIGGRTLPGTATSTLTASAGQQTLALTFTASGTGWVGKEVYCSKVGTTTPLFWIAAIDDVTTGTYNVTVADGSFATTTAPDKDFSSALPTGWTGYTNDRTRGGCGSTGTSILCYHNNLVTPTTGTSGARAGYVFGAGSPTWRARWRVDRFERGFPGATTGGAYYFGWAAWNSIGTVASDAVATGHFSSTAVSATQAFLFDSWRRTTAAAWTNVNEDQAQNFPVLGWPAYIQATSRAEGANYATTWAASPNGKDWNLTPRATGNQLTVCATLLTACTTVQPTSIGVIVEGLATSPSVGGLVEISQFTWQAE
ncbi:MAG: hypothetical protein WC969_14825 [Elusimicrobiota bacterium]|jgi:hypothetical protein